MARVSVVGSGASGVHFALTLLEKDYDVTMIDVGRERPAPPPLPAASFETLKETLEDPCRYFLGERYEGVVFPDSAAEYYGFPPSKTYVFEPPRGFGWQARGFAPLFSFARGGLAETWTGGSYPFNDAELTAFPFSYRELGPCYDEIARRIGIAGEEDDLARFMPVHGHLLEPLRLDQHSRLLLAAYERQRRALNDRLGCYLGRTRVATISSDLGERKACSYLGRCLWGCPSESLYTPSQTLRQCLAHPRFTYLPGMHVRYFRYDTSQRITELVAQSADGGVEQSFPVERLALAAGTLASSKIVLESVSRATGEVLRLPGLMDNRQLLVPFLNLRMLGQRYAPESYQYNLLGLGLESGDPSRYVHGQITTLKTTLMHPIVQRLPFDLATNTYLGRTLHAALGLVNVNFHDTRREENHVTLALDEFRPEAGDGPRLAVRYAPPADEPARMKKALATLTRALRRLGCIVVPGMAHMRPMGASVHYAGTFPMSRESAPWTTDEFCRSRDFENLFVVDGSSFPFLPAKN